MLILGKAKATRVKQVAEVWATLKQLFQISLSLLEQKQSKLKWLCIIVKQILPLLL